jgi:spore germination protein YaaH
MKNIYTFQKTIMLLSALIICACLNIGEKAEAATNDFEVTGWIPYWESKAGPKDARSHLDVLTSVYPFSYGVQPNGSVKDLASMKKGEWTKLIKDAKKKKVEVIPTVMWSDTAKIHEILSDEDKREDLVEEIGSIVRKNKYDGIDIDFEGKRAETKDFFSLFLTELKDELSSKILSCTIEARTPPESLYTVVPANIQYANDFNVIGDVCDRVNLMTYDQQRADLKLNDANSGKPYIPNADVAWVRKVAEFTAQTIPKEKIILGVATYGREWEVTVAPNWFQAYTKARSVNPVDALKVAKDYKLTPQRNSAGEVSIAYTPKGSRYDVSKYKGNDIAAKALDYANKTGNTTYFNLLWWSDAEAIEDKIDLAKSLGLAGIAIFKIDGGGDKKIWDILKDK